MDERFSLSDEEIRYFNENGFTRPFKIYDRDDAIQIGRAISRKAQVRKNSVYGQDCFANYDRHLDIEELATHIFRPQIVHRLQSLLGPDVVCWRSEFFTKFPGDVGTEWHQVEVYRYSTGAAQLEPTLPGAETFQLTCWTAFTPATLANGCMRLLPGSHQRWRYDEARSVKRPGLFDVRADKTSGFWGYEYADFKSDPDFDPDKQPAETMEMDAGHGFIFTAKCIHGSFPNTTKDTVRFSYGARYVSSHVKLYPGTTEFDEHGSHFDLKNYGGVLVAGEDRYHHNRLRVTTTTDVPFPPPLAAR